jgi:type IV secretion system protein VirD4
MTIGKRVAIGAAIVGYMALAVALALWLAGMLFFIMHRTLPRDVGVDTWLTYAHYYWHDGRQRSMLLVSVILGAAVPLTPAFILSTVLGGQGPELHGSAKFATPSDVRKAGLMGDAGIIVGKYRGQFLQFPGQQFCLLAAPTRSGKGVSFVIPNLLNWPESCVVLDIKLENFRLTSKFRADHGQAVYLFAPFAEDYKTHRWNPLDGISRNPTFRVGDLHTLASSLYPALPGDKDAFWQDTAKNLFLGLALMVMESPELPFTLGEILRQSGGQGKGLKEYIADRINKRIVDEKPYSGDCLDALHRFMSASDNTLANIITTFSAPLLVFANPLVDAATSASDFDIAKVRDRKMSIYIGIQPNRLAEASLLINVLFSQLININTKELPSKDSHRLQCLLIMDEFTAIGKVAVLAKANAFIAGYNLRLLTIIQSVAQLESVYGANDARTLITNHAMQVLFTPREQKDANAYSEMLGYYTLKATSKGRSVSRGLGGGGSNSENISDQRRALMLPQELKELPDSDQIIIYENTRPIQCEKARFFSDRAFMDRLKATSPTLAKIKGLPDKSQLDEAALVARDLGVAVPALDLDMHIAKVQQRTRPLKANEMVDLSKLNFNPADVPALADPLNPTDADAGNVVDGFFAAVGVDTGDVMSQMFGDLQSDNLMMEV